MLSTLADVKNGILPAASIAKSNASTGRAGTFRSSFYMQTVPPIGTQVATGASGRVMSSPTNNGGIAYQNITGGETVIASAVLKAAPTTNQVGSTMLVDRLWEMQALAPAVTTAITVNSVAWPARDINQSTNGDGVFIAMLIITPFATLTNAVLSISYTNSDGVAGRQGIYSVVIAEETASNFLVFSLQAGDTGVRSVQTYTSSVAFTAGEMQLVAFRPICAVPINRTPNKPFDKFRQEDVLTLCAPRIWNESVIEIITQMGTTTGPSINGYVQLAQG